MTRRAGPAAWRCARPPSSAFAREPVLARLPRPAPHPAAVSALDLTRGAAAGKGRAIAGAHAPRYTASNPSSAAIPPLPMRKPSPSARVPARLQFDLTSLRLFIATAELGGISKASERLALAPAAASRRIQDLESQFGLPLFERRPHGMALTEAGRALLAHARSIIHATLRMQDEAASFRGGERGVVRIAACKSVVLQFLAADLQRCMTECPGVHVDLQELNSQDVLGVMSRGLADIGIFEASVGPQPLAARPYRDDRLAVLVPSGHALARRRRVRLEDIVEHDLVALSEGSANAIALERHAGELQRTLRTRIRVNSYDSMGAMVTQGVGIGVMPVAVAEALARTAPVVSLRLDEDWAARRFLLCEQQPEALSQSARAISALLAPSQNAIPALAN